MIIFNNLGHCFKVQADSEPIVWVDAQDATTYTLSGNDVLTLDNKGSLGGAMTLNGSVKFANDGFESWSASDYITRYLGEPFLNTNSFTIATTFDLQDITSGSNSSYNWFSSVYADGNNRTDVLREINSLFIFNSNVAKNSQTYSLGLCTCVFSYDVSNNLRTYLNFNGNNSFANGNFTNVANLIVYLLKYGGGALNSGANNPLHEFRLYDKAFTLTEMQNLQTELNNKYTP